MLRPSRISRYVFAELMTPTILGLLLWTFILVMNLFFVVAEKALSKDLSFDLTLRMFVVGVPPILVLSIPMSVLLGSLIAVGRLSADHEWVALQGAGQGPMKLLKPLLLHGFLASLLAFYTYGELVPRSNFAGRYLQGQIVMSSSLASDLKPRVFYDQLENAVLYVDDILPGSPSEEGRLRGVLLITTEPEEHSFQVILARSGDIFPAADRSGTLIADLYDGVGHRYRPDAPDSYFLADFASHREPIPPPPYLQKLLEPPDKVTQDRTTTELFHELAALRQEQRETIARLVAEGRDPNNRQDRFIIDNKVRLATLELNARVALPLASFIFAVMALPLGINRARSGKGAAFALSLLVLLIYWLTYTFAQRQAVLGHIPAWLGAWASSLILAPWVVISLWRLRRPAKTDSGLLELSARAGRALRGRLSGRKRRQQQAEAANDGEGPAGVAALENIGGTTNRFVVRLDQYVGLQYLRILTLALVSAYLIYALAELRGLTQGLMRSKESPTLLLTYYEYFAPSVLHIILPVSCLIGAVVAFTLLARTGELTAVKASGISMRRATGPVLVLTAVLCFLLFLIEYHVVPVTNRLAQETEDKIMGRAPKTYGLRAGGRWGLATGGDKLYHYALYDKDRGEFQGLTVFTIDREAPRIVDHRYAQKARWRGNTAELEGGWFRSFEPDGTPAVYETFEGVRTIELEPPAQLVAKQIKLSARADAAEQMTLGELDDEIEVLKSRGYDTTHLEVAFWGKISRSTAPLVMVLLGLPFAFRVGKRGSLYGIGVALVLVLVYWAVFAIFNALGLETLLDPWAAAWAPNIFFGLLGTYLLLYVPT